MHCLINQDFELVCGTCMGSMNSVEWSGVWSELEWTTVLDYWIGVEHWTEIARLNFLVTVIIIKNFTASFL